jgi:putative MFS transporter
MESNQSIKNNYQVALLLVVASLGYFVDIYDLVLFGVVKAESLDQIMSAATASDKAATGKFLFNMQMLGMLLGGLLWGILGDKKGRLKVLFGSILLYSAANIANAYVTDVTSYTVIRVIAGIGLAGELGAGITLVSEMMSKEKRGYGTMLIVTFGALGGVVAYAVNSGGQGIAQWVERLTGVLYANWQIAYILGGIMGLLLLLMRVGTMESGFFSQVRSESHVTRGDLRLIFSKKDNLVKYIHCIVIGIPVWYVIGLLIMNSKDNFGPLLGVADVNNGQAVMFAYIGLSVGDLVSGFLSQILKSRKKVVALYLVFTLILSVIFLLFMHDISLSTYYFMCFLLGAGTGYWAIFVTIAAEQFGTNIRSTAANTIPNFVRGSVNLITLLFGILVSFNLNDGLAALLVGVLFVAFALLSISQLKETFGKDLNYIEIA